MRVLAKVTGSMREGIEPRAREHTMEVIRFRCVNVSVDLVAKVRDLPTSWLVGSREKRVTSFSRVQGNRLKTTQYEERLASLWNAS